MKKLFYLLLLALPVFITSCSNDEDKDTGISSFIIGSWYISSKYSYDEITFYDNGIVKSVCSYGDNNTFYDNGSFRVEITQTDDSGEKGVVYIKWAEEECVCDYFVIENELVWQMRGEESTSYWKRK